MKHKSLWCITVEQDLVRVRILARPAGPAGRDPEGECRWRRRGLGGGGNTVHTQNIWKDGALTSSLRNSVCTQASPAGTQHEPACRGWAQLQRSGYVGVKSAYYHLPFSMCYFLHYCIVSTHSNLVMNKNWNAIVYKLLQHIIMGAEIHFILMDNCLLNCFLDNWIQNNSYQLWHGMSFKIVGCNCCNLKTDFFLL